ncbi:zinc fingers and homeoboxes protein 2 [Rhineura floridana]|uniref:zinc fingers and homeoboxes protein 2 n=1 Tax=Rhineura floridana TaxID=261503 RepID=UPI002AC8891A|nr:zinc fingers and homeoboxes protein 2 [Rhineura floridana]XP_061461857.1 zinc fingers and homeoboxes protein 2 [Rhineura floridana]XP_061461866.1 zinc fingers and homeoboxes protein 2 [Rhineura floridana]XP_061461874.1 zinc fingers and homeoboxes protein 2 [Rhineura floridana]XP_061461883.1 zinc fingers and homeoboxes protein 2 [Rhineura floridana]XP_061461891.1 zinc fingers and homeoboxes protein 2 [Rhineura floridana]XP_061461900.1 zinc fingers and homeoboxes protein 2 [Rhineura floridan
MASKRKSTTPCMVRASESMEQVVPKDCNARRAAGTPDQDTEDGLVASKENCENDCEVIEGKSSPANPTRKPLGGYECKYCPYSTQNLNEFTEHIDMQHPNVILNPLYVCAECNFTTKKYDSLSEHNTKLHPGENNFKLKLIKLNNQTVLEQSIEVTNSSVVVETPEYELVPVGASSANKTSPVINVGKPKGETQKISLDKHLDGIPHLVTETTEPITCINGAELLQDILAHVMPSVQLPPNISLVPKVPVPLNSTKYNSALDTNATMINSFNKFPYPTQAELSWLTAASKHPEEQIRIWFATQRLKHGISWSPEEVEEARKKMFNGTIQPAAQTIAVLPAHVTAAKMPQPLIQTAVPCQILSQTGLVLTQVSNGSNVSPITLAVAASQGQKRSTQNQPAVPEAKRPHIVPAEVLSKPNTPATPISTTTMPLSPVLLTSSNDRKKTKEQIAALKASFIVSQFPDNAEVYRLIEITGLSRSEIKKWFSDHRYRSQRGIVHITSESIAKDQVALAAARQGRTYSPYPDITFQKFKGKSREQLGILEESFLKSSFPTQSELERLREAANITGREVESWFTERRKLRDNMEQAILDAMGSSIKNKEEGASNGAVSLTEQFYILQAPSSLSRCSTAFAPSSQEQVHFLKSTFVRTQWPSPQEYDELAAQTGLTRTEIVRWFKENRSCLRTGTLKWLDQYQRTVDGYNGIKSPVPTETLENSDDKEHQKLGKQNVEGMEKSKCNHQDSQGNDENQDTGNVSWEEVTIDDDDDDDDASDCMESWDPTVPGSKADLDSESISGDNSHT